MGLFEELNKEHKIIKEFVSIFKKTEFGNDERDLSISKVELGLEFIGNYVDKYHHGKEEDILFPFVASLGLTKNGGPHCTHFFGMMLDSGYNDKIKELVSQDKGVAPYVLKKELEPLRDQQSPLLIPLKDHESGYYLVQMMTLECERLRANTLHDSLTLSRLIRWYEDMLTQHIRKEDECLFVRLEDMISAEQLLRLNENVKVFNENFKKEHEVGLLAFEKLRSL